MARRPPSTTGPEHPRGTAGGDGPQLRLVLPHQLFEAHLEADPGTRFVLIEHDLLFRQYPFHAHKLVLHRASMTRFARRLRAAGFEADVLRSDPAVPTGPRLTELVDAVRPGRVTVFDVVDDWLGRDLVTSLAAAGHELRRADVLESPSFLTDRPAIDAWFAEHPARMQDFYPWQRRRLDVLVEGPDSRPVGGRWSFDEENRRKLPRGYRPPPVPRQEPQDEDVRTAIQEVAADFPDAPGEASTFSWPTDHEEARSELTRFVSERLAGFGPYEDALSGTHPFIHHSLLSPLLNTGLLDPREVIAAVLDGAGPDVPLASVEGFVRQLIGWREFMRATYRVGGRAMRTRNHLGHTRRLGSGWWNGRTGLVPVDMVLGRVLHRGYAHHIERLMVLGGAMCLLRIDPEEVHAWFMSMFIDAYDWVMVPNVHAMSQFAAGDAITTKPYVSGSSYLRRMSDLGPGDWREDWDALYWTFVEDQHDLFARGHRTRMVARNLERMDDDRRTGLRRRAAEVMSRSALSLPAQTTGTQESA